MIGYIIAFQRVQYSDSHHIFTMVGNEGNSNCVSIVRISDLQLTHCTFTTPLFPLHTYCIVPLLVLYSNSWIASSVRNRLRMLTWHLFILLLMRLALEEKCIVLLDMTSETLALLVRVPVHENSFRGHIKHIAFQRECVINKCNNKSNIYRKCGSIVVLHVYIRMYV